MATLVQGPLVTLMNDISPNYSGVFVVLPGDADVVGVFVVLDHVWEEGDDVHGEGQPGLRAGGVDEGKVQEERELGEQFDGRLVGVGVGAAFQQQRVGAREVLPFKLEMKIS